MSPYLRNPHREPDLQATLGAISASFLVCLMLAGLVGASASQAVIGGMVAAYLTRLRLVRAHTTP